jgi:hypothetical protein
VLTVADNNGECVVLVKDQQRKIVKAVTLEDWNKNKKENEARYGTMPPAPLSPPVTDIKAAMTAPAQVAPVAPVAPAAPVKTTGVVETMPAVPLNTDASLRVQPVTPQNGMVKLTPANTLTPPMYIVDGKEMETGYDLNTLHPEDIQSISVWKDEKATSKYGEKAKYGVIDITTKKKNALPDGILIVLDGKELPAGSKIEDYVQPDAIESMNVLKDKTATIKYGDKGVKGVIEIKTKLHNRIVNGQTDTIVLIKPNSSKSRLEAWKGVGTDGAARTQSISVDAVYYVDGNEVSKEVAEQIVPSSILSVAVFKGPEAVKKYGEKGKNGIIEIKTKKAVIN